MSRLPPLDPGDADPQVRAALERLPPLAIFATVANAQGSFVNWLRFGGDCLDARLFDPVLRELAILRVARLTPGADYEWTQHVPILLAVGGNGRLVVRFTTQVVRDATPDESTFAQMSARFSPAEIVQLLLVIGQYMMVGRVMATARIDLDAVLGSEVLAEVQRAAQHRG
jgi:4-carboxymuconolactone decarboxylase